MKKRIITVSVLVLLTALLAFIYLHSRDSIKTGDLRIVSTDAELTVTFSDLSLSHANGSVTNKKGETKEIDADGIPLSEIPALAGVNSFNGIKVIADDEYSASVSADEAEEPGKAWLIDDNGKIRLIVFGDDGASRDVKNVVRIEIK